MSATCGATAEIRRICDALDAVASAIEASSSDAADLFEAEAHLYRSMYSVIVGQVNESALGKTADATDDSAARAYSGGDLQVQ